MDVKHLIQIIMISCMAVIVTGCLGDSDDPKLTPDVLQVKEYHQLSREFLYSNPKQAMRYAEMELELSKSINYAEGRLKALSLIGAIHTSQEEYHDALNVYSLMLRIDILSRFPAVKANVLHSIGHIYHQNNMLDVCLSFYFEAYNAYEGLGSKANQAALHHSIGQAYAGNQDYSKGLWYYERSLEAYKALGDNLHAARVLNSLGILLKNQGRYTDALASYRKSLDLLDPKDKSLQTVVWNNIGEVYADQQQYNQAKQYYDKVIDQKILAGQSRSLISTYNQYAKMLLAQGMEAEAKQYYELGAKAGENMGYSPHLATNLESLARLYEKEKNVTGSGHCYKRLHAIEKPQIALLDNLKEMNRKLQLQLTRSEIEMQQQRSEAKQDFFFQFSIILLLVLSLSWAIFEFLRYRRKTKRAAMLILEKISQQV